MMPSDQQSGPRHRADPALALSGERSTWLGPERHSGYPDTGLNPPVRSREEICEAPRTRVVIASADLNPAVRLVGLGKFFLSQVRFKTSQ